jgi:hypothetical protein
MYVTRRIYLDLLATFVAVATVAITQAGAQQPQKPNVVFILADNVGYGDLVHRFYETGHLRGIHCDSIALYPGL